MNKIAFIFPGQGSQTIGMGIALADAHPEARTAFDQASKALHWDLYEACKNGPEDRLRQTDVAQPALYVTGYAAQAVLRSFGITPDAVAGHSIGEYAALASAGAFSFLVGLDLVKERARLMQAAASARPGGMVAVLGLDRGTLEKLCSSVQAAHGVCVPVNFNSPEQIVVAGEKKAVEALAAEATGAGAKRVIPLNVSGAFHSPLMAEAAAGMKDYLGRMSFHNAICPVVMNSDGESHQGAGAILEALAPQLDHSVEWVKSVESLREMGCGIFVECGPGRVLSGLVRRVDKQLGLYSTETAAAIEEVKNALAATRKGTE